MYIPFVLYVSMGILITSCFLFEKARKTVVGIAAVALLVYGACALQNAAMAEEIVNVAVIRDIDKGFLQDAFIEVEIFNGSILTYVEDATGVFNDDKDINEIAISYFVNNGVVVKTTNTPPLYRGRVVVIINDIIHYTRFVVGR